MASRTIVVKVGSSTVTGHDGRVDREYLASLVKQIAALRLGGDRVVLVSSGAIASGMEALNLRKRPADIPTLQAAAAVGQVRLVHTYEHLFAEEGVPVGQVLLTRQDIAHRQQYLHACHTLERLLAMDVVPVVNENDTTAVDEIRLGDNDQLAALVAIMVHADLVLLLTDIAGVYSSDPRIDESASLLERIETLDEAVVAAAGGPGSGLGSGGMATKLEAGRMLMKAGIPMVVCDGRRGGVVVDAASGENVGTVFASGEAGVKARKLWIAFGGRAVGSVTIDDGARDALCLRGGSLLPAGVTDVSGSFVVGEAVTLKDTSGRVVGRGLAGMSSDDLSKVRGMKTAEIAEVLPGWNGAEVVHRDHLVIL